MITFPGALEEIGKGELRAGGTDLTERRHTGVSAGPVVDLRDVRGLDAVEEVEGGLRVGAKVTVAALAGDARVRAGWPGLAQAAGGLATPQIRAVATVGGNLAQRPRCWYYRHPDASCLKKGGDTCLARQGDHLYHALFDTGPCVAVHASTLGCALLAYDASVEVYPTHTRAMAAFFEAPDPTRENALLPGETIVAVRLPPPAPGEKAVYLRAIARARAEWPLVEVTARRFDGGVRVAVGGVANAPMRLPNVEAALFGGLSPEKAAALAGEGANPLPMTGYKRDLLVGTVLTALEAVA